MKLTQKEKVARYLVAQMPNWVASYTLIEKVAAGHITNDADTRAHQLVREGYVSPNATYTFESRKAGRFTEFRCKERVAKNINLQVAEIIAPLNNLDSLESLQAGNLKWFNEL